MGNVLIALSTLSSLASQIAQLTGMLQAAQAEGRDLTDAELAQVQFDYAQAHQQLDGDIAASRAPAKQTP